MKRRRTLVISILLVAALCLGIGYAALTDTLTIGGNANVKPHAENLKVEFTDITEIKKCTAAIQTDKTVASFTTTQLLTTGDTASAKFTVTNNSPELSATIDAPVITNNNTEYFEITTDFPAAGKTLAKGESMQFTVTVKLIKTSVEEQACEFTITNDVTGVEITAP